MQQNKKTIAVWFTQNLRTEDNNVLITSARSGLPVIGVYFFDPKNFLETAYGFKKTERYRAQFILESLKTLRENLNRHNIALQVYINEPQEGFVGFVKQYQVQEIFVQKEWTYEERASIDAVKNKLDIPVREIEDQLLYHSEDFFMIEREIPEVFTPFKQLCEKKLQVRKPKAYSHQNPVLFEPITQNSLPSIQDFGLNKFVKDPRSAFPFYGGENAALARLEDYIWGTQNIRIYKKTRNGLIGTEYSSKLAPWLSVGAISAR
ncbi:MAG: deoxyribodipyrimidine photo-lyase, partial [Flavobacteriaceae bacterium]|nr:deoxyribodipyrimidine photo-lyase [Flavobacteriaceae bacterium]